MKSLPEFLFSWMWFVVGVHAVEEEELVPGGLQLDAVSERAAVRGQLELSSGWLELDCSELCFVRNFSSS